MRVDRENGTPHIFSWLYPLSSTIIINVGFHYIEAKHDSTQVGNWLNLWCIFFPRRLRLLFHQFA